jgi:hypothetical protein
MKSLLTFFSIALLGAQLSFGDQLLPTAPETVTVAFAKVFVPSGFDDNDRTQITIEGVFPNTCYKVGPYATQIDLKTRTITIQQQAYRYQGICLQVVVPFHQVVDLGLIPQGEYKIVDSASGSALSVIRIDIAKKSEPDEYLYAPITDAFITTDPENGIHTLGIQGAFTDRCTVFEDIKVNYTADVIVVQPIVKRIGARSCAKDKTRFMRTVQLKESLTGMYLLHVRSMNGQAINKMVDLP